MSKLIPVPLVALVARLYVAQNFVRRVGGSLRFCSSEAQANREKAPNWETMQAFRRRLPAWESRDAILSMVKNNQVKVGGIMGLCAHVAIRHPLEASKPFLDCERLLHPSACVWRKVQYGCCSSRLTAVYYIQYKCGQASSAYHSRKWPQVFRG